MNPALVNEIVSQQKELESLREQLEDMLQSVAQAECERDALREQLENAMVVVGRVERERDALITAIDDQMVTTHIGVFSAGDDPKEALHKLMGWSQSVGEFFAKDALKTDQEPVMYWGDGQPLYLHPSPVVSSEPIAWMVGTQVTQDRDAAIDGGVCACMTPIPLYLHPARHLSDDELTEMWDRAWNTGHSADKVIVAFARAVLEKANG